MGCNHHTLYLLFLILFLGLTSAYSPFLIAGTPNKYAAGEVLNVMAVKISSIPKALPFSFYKYHDDDIPFCRPDNMHGTCALGECLAGDYKQHTLYNMTFLKDNGTCVPLANGAECSQSGGDYAMFRELIDYKYRAQITLDGLPVAELKKIHGDEWAEIGFEIGTKTETTSGTFRYHLNNHLNFTVGYYKDKSDNLYVISFDVTPQSINYTSTAEVEKCNDGKKKFPADITTLEGKSNIIWTYSFNYVQVDTLWAHRWDDYFTVNEDLHWVSLAYAIVVTTALSVFLGVVLVKIIRTSVARYSHFEDVEESGWKTLHGDVFRAPHHFMILSILVGAGTQILATAFFVLLVGAIGFVSPASSGSLNAAIVAIYPMLGFVGGYASARVYGGLGGARKRRNAVFTAFGFQGIIFFVWFMADCVLWVQDSSAGRASTFFSIFALWFCVSVPLTFLGAWFSYRRPQTDNPTGTNTIPRMIPKAPWYSHPYLLTPILAVLPFGVAFNEIYDIMDAMWSHHVYYFFGVVLTVFVLLTIIVAEVSVVLCYFQLANENYHWWWRAFHIPAVVVGFAMGYVGTMDLEGSSSRFLYFCYTLIVLLVFFVLMSSVAFYACWKFVTRIYSTLHVD